jgi:hypothetical protein
MSSSVLEHDIKAVNKYSDSNMMLFMSCDAMSCPSHHVRRPAYREHRAYIKRADKYMTE